MPGGGLGGGRGRGSGSAARRSARAVRVWRRGSRAIHTLCATTAVSQPRLGLSRAALLSRRQEARLPRPLAPSGPSCSPQAAIRARWVLAKQAPAAPRRRWPMVAPAHCLRGRHPPPPSARLSTCGSPCSPPRSPAAAACASSALPTRRAARCTRRWWSTWLAGVRRRRAAAPRRSTWTTEASSSNTLQPRTAWRARWRRQRLGQRLGRTCARC